MKWTPRKESEVGDWRVVRRFLFWPKTLDGQTRWLEMATWVRVYGCYGPIDIGWDSGSKRIEATETARLELERLGKMTIREQVQSFCVRMRIG